MSQYAVLIPRIETADGDALLLEVRSHKIRQPGEVCFPGGRVEPGETVTEAAVRETCEELGVTAGMIEVMSELDSFTMGDGRSVNPVEARIRIADLESLELSKDEVAEVFLLPLAWLAANPPEHFDLSITADEDLPDKLLGYLSNYGSYRHTGATGYLEYDGHGIWGLTARIIESLVTGTVSHH